jgi:hypothetical protein
VPNTNPIDEIEMDANAVAKLARTIEKLGVDRVVEALLAVEKALQDHAAERRAASKVMNAVLQEATATGAAFKALQVELAAARADLSAMPKRLNTLLDDQVKRINDLLRERHEKRSRFRSSCGARSLRISSSSPALTASSTGRGAVPATREAQASCCSVKKYSKQNDSSTKLSSVRSAPASASFVTVACADASGLTTSPSALTRVPWRAG